MAKTATIKRKPGRPRKVRPASAFAGMTPEQIAASTKHRWAWIAENLSIIGKDGDVRRMLPNRGQCHLIAAMQLQESKGLPVRIILLKSRQFGGSTAIQADIFARCYLLENRRSFTCAHDAMATNNLYGMTKFYQLSMDKRVKLPTDAVNGYELAFSQPHGGRMRIATAGTPDAARSGTFQYAHLSEIPSWPDQAGALQAIDAAVPERPGTAIFKESTAKGIGDRFHDDWVSACAGWQRGDLSWIPVFVGWLQDTDCRLPVPDWYDWDSAPGDVTEDEPELVRMGATREQLYWRRLKVRNYGGDLDRFHEEYPATADEAFIASGRPAISAQIIAHHRTTVQEGRKFRLELDPMEPCGVRAIEDADLREPFWRVWRPPFENGDYAIGGDVAEGGLADPNNPSSDPDRSYALVIERATLEDAAEWIGRTEADLFGLELLKAGLWFNKGWTTPEANPSGQASLLVLKRWGYPRIMQRALPIDKIGGKPVMSDGWKTTTANREPAIDDLIAYMRPKPGNDYEGQIVIHSGAFLDECGTFIHVGASGKRQHMPGKHDDTIFARLVALQIHLNCPRTVVVKKWKPPKPRGDLKSLAFLNAIDPGPSN